VNGSYRPLVMCLSYAAHMPLICLSWCLCGARVCLSPIEGEAHAHTGRAFGKALPVCACAGSPHGTLMTFFWRVVPGRNVSMLNPSFTQLVTVRSEFFFKVDRILTTFSGP
jgi:hypothetical protein